MARAVKRDPDAWLGAVLKTANPGIVAVADAHNLCDEMDAVSIVAWARSQRVDVAVIGPEAPLEAGLVDALLAAGIPCASPTRAAARIETDKQFMRRLMDDHEVAGRLGHHHFTDREEALRFLDKNGPCWAIKPVGLTGGKGVQVHGDHFQDLAGAKAYASSIFDTGAGGGSLQFEELAIGEEFTVMAFTDGRTVLPMPAVQDHKRLRDGDEGPNTGGMGAYSMADGLLPFLTRADYDDAVAIVQQIVDALRRVGAPYKGAIYGQFMLTADGPRVIEVNARFGDPEAMNALQLLRTPYPTLLAAMAAGALGKLKAEFRSAATVVRYMVPRGYGEGTPAKGEPVTIDEAVLEASGATLYFANIGTDDDGRFTTGTSRTLAVLGEGADLETARETCERGMMAINGPALVWRTDIGSPALVERRVANMRRLRRQTIEQ